MITQDLARPLYEILESTVLQLGGTPICVGGMPDHVHLLVSLPPTVSVSTAVQRLKAASTTTIRLGRLSPLRFGWQAHYGAFTVSVGDKEKIINYIKNQREHHAAGKIWPSLETAFVVDLDDE